jgi:hypothetical protein
MATTEPSNELARRPSGAGSKDAEAAAEAAATAFEAHGFTQLADRSRELVA